MWVAKQHWFWIQKRGYQLWDTEGRNSPELISVSDDWGSEAEWQDGPVVLCQLATEALTGEAKHIKSAFQWTI